MNNENFNQLGNYPDLICTGCELLSEQSTVNGTICPICGSDLIPCDRCIHCGEFYGVDELYNGACKRCDESINIGILA